MTNPSWFADFEVPAEGAWRWRLGPFELHVENRVSEWLVAWEAGQEWSSDAFETGPLDPAAFLSKNQARFASHADENGIRLRARLADRPVVARPETPVWVLGGDTVDFFLSTPLWITASTAETDRLLVEAPSHRPPDTWFGANTREGELAYASRTRAQRAPIRHAFRATTRLAVINHEPTSLQIDRLKLPVPSLDLYVDAEGRFWTSAVTVAAADGGAVGMLEVVPGPPEGAAEPTLVAEARVPLRNQLGVVRALSVLWT